jgi:hypothetical protein
MNTNKISTLFKLYILSSAVFSVAVIFALWLMGKSDNKLARSCWNMISSEYMMGLLVLARPFMSQAGFEHSLKSQQDRFVNSMIELWRACVIVK